MVASSLTTGWIKLFGFEFLFIIELILLCKKNFSVVLIQNGVAKITKAIYNKYKG